MLGAVVAYWSRLGVSFCTHDAGPGGTMCGVNVQSIGPSSWCTLRDVLYILAPRTPCHNLGFAWSLTLPPMPIADGSNTAAAVQAGPLERPRRRRERGGRNRSFHACAIARSLHHKPHPPCAPGCRRGHGRCIIVAGRPPCGAHWHP